MESGESMFDCFLTCSMFCMGNPKTAYDKSPEKFFVFEEYCEDDDDYAVCSNGFLIIGTHRCQWDYGIITSGERRGQIFDTDNEGAYLLSADSFSEFYQNWLDRIS